MIGHTSIAMPTTVGAGTDIKSVARNCVNKWLQVNNTDWNGVLAVMGSMDGTLWAEIARRTFSGAAATEFVELPVPVRLLRVDSITDTSGTEPSLRLGWENG